MSLRRAAAQKHLASTLQGLLVMVDCRRFSRWEGKPSSHLPCFSDVVRRRLSLGGMLSEDRWRILEALEVFGRPEIAPLFLGAVEEVGPPSPCRCTQVLELSVRKLDH